LAAAQTLVFVIGAQWVGLGLAAWPGDVGWLVAGCMVGFLAFNFPPARMFMGDVGSNLLGVLTGALALVWWQQRTLPLPAALLLLSGFWLDATYTLIVRALTGQAFTQAHRSHLYQKLAARRGHSWTTVCFLLYAVLWLVPLSWLCARYDPELSLTTMLWLLPAVAPPLVAAGWLGAGHPDPRTDEPHV
jgi:Fuc2NAc and GlcNAc transferase